MTAEGWTYEAARVTLPVMLVSTAFSSALGLWISRIIDQSAERAGLIQELEKARAELGAAYHTQGVQAERERLAREIHDTLAQATPASSCSPRWPRPPSTAGGPPIRANSGNG